MIRVINVCYDFVVSAIKRSVILNISFELPSGCILAIVGPSGCGKTTLMRILTGFLTPNCGQVLLDDNPPQPQEGKLGVMFQESRLLPWRSVFNNIRLPLEVRDSRDSNSLKELLGLMRLIDHAHKLPGELSGGHKERTALARALVTSPKFIFMDEPLSSTDYVHRIEIEDYIYAVVHRDRRCAVLVTHELEQAAAIADQILILGFATGESQPSTMLEVPLTLRQLEPSQARVHTGMPEFLKQVLMQYRLISPS